MGCLRHDKVIGGSSRSQAVPAQRKRRAQNPGCAMIERPLPPLFPLIPRRVPLGLTLWAPIRRGTSYVIRTYPQLDAFWPDRLLLGARSHWIINEASIEGQPWLGTAHGAVYSPAEWTRLPVRKVSAGGEVQLTITYVGPGDEAKSFEAALF